MAGHREVDLDRMEETVDHMAVEVLVDRMEEVAVVILQVDRREVTVDGLPEVLADHMEEVAVAILQVARSLVDHMEVVAVVEVAEIVALLSLIFWYQLALVALAHKDRVVMEEVVALEVVGQVAVDLHKDKAAMEEAEVLEVDGQVVKLNV